MEHAITKCPPFAGYRAFLNDYGQYAADRETLDLSAYREAQCEGETVKCHICAMTISASAMLACSACAS